LGFYNEEIISEITTDILFFPLFINFDKFTIVVSNIGFSSREDLLYAGSGYTSSLLSRRGSETYLILQQVLDDHCSLQVYKGSNEVYQYVGETPTVVWKNYGMYEKKDHLALFGLKDPKVRALLTNEKEYMTCMICTSLKWNDTSILQPIFDLHIKRRKISIPNEDWHVLFTKWLTQDIVEVAKGLSGTSLAEIKINRDDRSSGSEAEDIELNQKKNNKNSKQKKKQKSKP
ncbi:8562_t:CDS:2, partial [Racocetra fulgida]